MAVVILPYIKQKGPTMDYDQAMLHEPTEAEVISWLSDHGGDDPASDASWPSLIEFCQETNQHWSAPGVVMSFLGY